MENKEENLVLIDADSIIYILGSKLENMPIEPLGIMEIDQFLKDILIATDSKYFIGFFGGSGRNFRKDVAVTKKYKGNRDPIKPEWFNFWAPIFKRHMEKVWGFQPCDNIEADDAVAIAAEVYRGKFKKDNYSFTDKDLCQIPETWFYNYDKRTTFYINENVAAFKLCMQMITGDTSDNIPGLSGAGDVVANEQCLAIQRDGLTREEGLKSIKEFYIHWHTVVLLDKLARRQEVDFLVQFKKDNDIKRFTKTTKSDALGKFVVDRSSLLGKTGAIKLYNEQYTLLNLINTEKEAKKHGFILRDVCKDTKVDWSKIEIFRAELEEVSGDDDFEFIDDL